MVEEEIRTQIKVSLENSIDRERWKNNKIE